MAIAQRTIGVRQGYRKKTTAIARRESTLLQRAVASLLGGAREMRVLLSDEIIYATLDTARFLNYARTELGLARRSGAETVAHDLEHFLVEREASLQEIAWSVERGSGA